MVSTLQDELPSTFSATHMSPQISDIEDEDLFASASTQHEPSGGFLHVSLCVVWCGMCVCICVEGVCLGYKKTGSSCESFEED